MLIATRSRRGVAAWELLIALVVLTSLMALVLALGRAGQSAVVAAWEARRSAWEARGAMRAGSPLKASRMSAGRELVERTATVPVRNLPAARAHSAESRHSAPYGSWDERDLPLADDRPWLPSFKLIQRIGAGLW